MTDLLASAVAAARTSAEDGADDGAATRLRIRESLAKRTSKKRLWTLLAAAIGTMFASTAFALQAGWEPPWSSKTEAVAPAAPDPDPPATPDAPRRTSRASSEPSTTVRFESVPPLPISGANQAIADEAPLPAPPVVAEPEQPAAPTRGVDEPVVARAPARAAEPPPSRAFETAPSRAVEPAPARVVEPAPSRTIEPPGTTGSPAVDSAPPRAVEPAPPRVVEPAKAPVADAELAAYRSAHTLHFRGTDPAAALAAWDALLAKFPSGRLAPEARFNRAVALVKLKRWSDARAALAPFASAPPGSYRQREAQQLIEAIANR